MSRTRCFVARYGPFPLQGIQQCGPFAAYISSCAKMKNQLQVVTRTQNIFPQIVAVIRLSNCLAQPFLGQRVLPAQENKGNVGLSRIRGNDHAFNKLVRISVHEEAIFECGRLHLIRVSYEVPGPGDFIRRRHCLPFHARRKPRPTTTSQLGLLHHRDNFLRSHRLESFANRLVAACFFVFLQTQRRFIRSDVFCERSFHQFAS